MITVQAIECPNCKDVIYSRARHDFHYCSCGGVFVDGGFDYTRYGGTAEPVFVLQIQEIKIDSTEEELYQDWNKATDKFGIIKSVK